jgi:hypothetical protein
MLEKWIIKTPSPKVSGSEVQKSERRNVKTTLVDSKQMDQQSQMIIPN